MFLWEIVSPFILPYAKRFFAFALLNKAWVILAAILVLLGAGAFGGWELHDYQDARAELAREQAKTAALEAEKKARVQEEGRSQTRGANVEKKLAAQHARSSETKTVKEKEFAKPDYTAHRFTPDGLRILNERIAESNTRRGAAR